MTFTLPILSNPKSDYRLIWNRGNDVNHLKGNFSGHFKPFRDVCHYNCINNNQINAQPHRQRKSNENIDLRQHTVHIACYLLFNFVVNHSLQSIFWGCLTLWFTHGVFLFNISFQNAFKSMHNATDFEWFEVVFCA